MWRLNNIPKVLHVYWGGGKMSYLRYLTIETFRYYNPDWEVILYKPAVNQVAIHWKTKEQDYADHYEDYLDKVETLGVLVKSVDFTTMGFPDTAAEVHKSDFLRWELLSHVGGVWADMDILFIKPMDELSFNIKKNRGVNTVFCISDYGHSIGFLMGSENNSCFRKIREASYAEYQGRYYQCIGSLLCNKIFPDMAAVTASGAEPYNLPMDVVYAHNANNVKDLFAPSAMEKLTDNSIGIHWYAGNSIAGQYLNTTNGGLTNRGTSIIDKYITLYEDKRSNVIPQ
jgi:hypothetical protein